MANFYNAAQFLEHCAGLCRVLVVLFLSDGKVCCSFAVAAAYIYTRAALRHAAGCGEAHSRALELALDF